MQSTFLIYHSSFSFVICYILLANSLKYSRYYRFFFEIIRWPSYYAICVPNIIRCFENNNYLYNELLHLDNLFVMMPKFIFALYSCKYFV